MSSSPGSGAAADRPSTPPPATPPPVHHRPDNAHAGRPGREEPARLAALRRYQILDTPPDGAFDRVAALAARFVRVPIATVTIVDEHRIWFKARHGLDQGPSEIPRDPGLCASAILQDAPYLVTEATADPRALANPLVRGTLGLRFYAAAPITTPNGFRLGTVNVIDRHPRQATAEELSVLADLAAVVASELELRLSAIRTVTAERHLRAQLEREKAHLEQIAKLEAKLAEQLQHALDHRVVIEQAKGMLMAREGLDAQTAFERLRTVARSQRRRVEEIATTVLAGTPLPAPAPPATRRAGRQPPVMEERQVDDADR